MKRCLICEKKLNKQFVLNLKLFIFYSLLKFNRNLKNSWQLNNFNTYKKCNECKIFQSSFIFRENANLLANNLYKRKITTEYLKMRKVFYLEKYKILLDRLKKNKKLNFFEVSSDCGFLLEYLKDQHNCYGCEPEKLSFDVSKNLNLNTYNKTFEDSLQIIKNEKINWLSFSSSFSSIKPEDIYKLSNFYELEKITIIEMNFEKNNDFSLANSFFQKKLILHNEVSIINILKIVGFVLTYKNNIKLSDNSNQSYFEFEREA